MTHILTHEWFHSCWSNYQNSWFWSIHAYIFCNTFCKVSPQCNLNFTFPAFLVILSLFSLFNKFPIISIKKSFESNEPFVFNLNDPSLRWLSIFVILIHRGNGWHSSNNIYIIYMIKYIKDIQLDLYEYRVNITKFISINTC